VNRHVVPRPLSTALRGLALLWPGFVAIVAAVLWYRTGMWDKGAMPTHGLILVLSGSVAAYAALAGVRLIEKASKEPPAPGRAGPHRR